MGQLEVAWCQVPSRRRMQAPQYSMREGTFHTLCFILDVPLASDTRLVTSVRLDAPACIRDLPDIVIVLHQTYQGVRPGMPCRRILQEIVSDIVRSSNRRHLKIGAFDASRLTACRNKPTLRLKRASDVLPEPYLYSCSPHEQNIVAPRSRSSAVGLSPRAKALCTVRAPRQKARLAPVVLP